MTQMYKQLMFAFHSKIATNVESSYALYIKYKIIYPFYMCVERDVLIDKLYY